MATERPSHATALRFAAIAATAAGLLAGCGSRLSNTTAAESAPGTPTWSRTRRACARTASPASPTPRSARTAGPSSSSRPVVAPAPNRRRSAPGPDLPEAAAEWGRPAQTPQRRSAATVRPICGLHARARGARIPRSPIRLGQRRDYPRARRESRRARVPIGRGHLPQRRSTISRVRPQFVGRSHPRRRLNAQTHGGTVTLARFAREAGTPTALVTTVELEESWDAGRMTRLALFACDGAPRRSGRSPCIARKARFVADRIAHRTARRFAFAVAGCDVHGGLTRDALRPLEPRTKTNVKRDGPFHAKHKRVACRRRRAAADFVSSSAAHTSRSVGPRG